MTQAAIFLATCPKSNTTLSTYSAARAAVLEHGPLQVPLKLRNAPTPMMKSMGYSGGYKYPHNFSGNYVPEDYLPDELRGQRFYEPSSSGEEADIRERLQKWREKK
jgi:putative ATPase